MEDLDFMGTPAKPAPPPKPKPAVAAAEQASLYQPRLALEFFKLGGSLEQFPAGKQIFAENDKAGKAGLLQSHRSAGVTGRVRQDAQRPR